MVFKRLPFGVANAAFLFSYERCSKRLGPKSGLIVYVDDCTYCSSTWKSHLVLLEDMFKALQVGGFTLKPTKMQFGPKQVKYLGQVLSADGIRVGDDCKKNIVDLPTPKRVGGNVTAAEQLCKLRRTLWLSSCRRKGTPTEELNAEIHQVACIANQAQCSVVCPKCCLPQSR